MRKLLVITGILAVLASAASAQQFVLAMAKSADGTTVVRAIPIYHLDVASLCAALGGITVSLYGNGGISTSFGAPGTRIRPFNNPAATPGSAPAPMTGTPAPTAPAAPFGTLNRTAPLTPWVSPAMTDIVGLR